MKILVFFADKGVTEITNHSKKTLLLMLRLMALLNKKTLEEYLLTMSRFNDKNLDLIKTDFEAKKENDTAQINASKKSV